MKSKTYTPDMNLKSTFENNLPMLKFLSIFGILLILYYTLSALGYLFPITNFLAEVGVSLSSIFITLFYPKLETTGNILMLEGFRVNVGAGCDGLEVIALFIIAVISFPSSFKQKIPAILLGTVFLFLMNLFRIIGLFFIGYKDRELLDFFHHNIFPFLFIIIVFMMWYSWIKWTKVNG